MSTDENTTPGESEPEVQKDGVEGPKYPNWEYRTEVKIVSTMKEIIHKTLEATRSEVDSLRKKLEKLQYGG